MEDQLARLVSSADDATRRTQALEQRLAYFENLSYETTRAQRYANAEYLRLAQDRTSSGEKRILVAGWYGAGNLGDELILRALLSHLPEKAPGRTTVLLWDNPTYERLSLDLRVNTIHYPTTTWQLKGRILSNVATPEERTGVGNAIRVRGGHRREAPRHAAGQARPLSRVPQERDGPRAGREGSGVSKRTGKVWQNGRTRSSGRDERALIDWHSGDMEKPKRVDDHHPSQDERLEIADMLRRGGHSMRQVASTVVVTAIGYDEGGWRRVLAFGVVDTESYDSWLGLLRGVRKRGVSGVRLTASDAHPGLAGAVGEALRGAAWQRCAVHLMRDCVREAGSAQPRRRVARIVAPAFRGRGADGAGAMYHLACEML